MGKVFPNNGEAFHISVHASLDLIFFEFVYINATLDGAPSVPFSLGSQFSVTWYGILTWLWKLVEEGPN